MTARETIESVSKSGTPSRLPFTRAFYIKLGAGGVWAEDSIKNGLLRLGWSAIPLSEIRNRRWSRIEKRLRTEDVHAGVATRDLNGLRDIVLSTRDDVWITFHQSKLWWGRLAETEMEKDATSKFRRPASGWSDRAIDGSVLIATQLPGVLSATQGFRGTICSVRAPEVLHRVLTGGTSLEHERVREAKRGLSEAVAAAIRALHWKDFETLVDLVFRHAGWRRTSLLGETMKYADLELEEPITRDRYQIQVKSSAGLADFRRCAGAFSKTDFRRLYFVVHTPSKDLEEYVPDPGLEAVILMRPLEFAGMVVSAGLTDWLLDRIR